MKKFIIPYLAVALSLMGLPAFSQEKDKKPPVEDTTELLGLAGDNLDLYAVLDVFQKSKTIEAFEKALNDDDPRINNLDLNLDKKIDFIKVVTKKDGDAYQFILRVDIKKDDAQDVAVILLNKDKDKNVSLQIVGDEELYGKDYVIEPKGNSSVTANPGYTGDNPVTVNVPQTTVVVQQQPIVQYVYSPAYVPYASPYYYGYYPGWFAFATVMAVGFYRSACWGYHGGYYGGHYGGGNNNIIINNGNRNNFNNYNNNKMRSNTVSDNRARGSYGDGAGANRRNNANRPTTSDRGNNLSNNRGNNPSVSNRAGSNPSVSNNRAGNNASTSNRQSPSTSNRSSSGISSPSTSNRSSSGFSNSNRSGSSMSGGGGRSMSGGGMRGGGGGGGRRR